MHEAFAARSIARSWVIRQNPAAECRPWTFLLDGLRRTLMDIGTPSFQTQYAPGNFPGPRSSEQSPVGRDAA